MVLAPSLWCALRDLSVPSATRARECRGCHDMEESSARYGKISVRQTPLYHTVPFPILASEPSAVSRVGSGTGFVPTATGDGQETRVAHHGRVGAGAPITEEPRPEERFIGLDLYELAR